MIILIWYKGSVFVYERGILVEEIFLLFFLFALQRARVALGKRGHKTHGMKLLFLFMFLAIPAAYLIGYHLNMQLYVLRLDVFLCAITLSFLIFECLLGLLWGVAVADTLVPRIVLAVALLLIITVASV